MEVQEQTTQQKPDFRAFVKDWRLEFTERIKVATKSRKQEFRYIDAINKSDSLRTDFDSCMIEYLKFINSQPLTNNDYFKYVNAYVNGKTLNLKYFKHNVDKLHEYYKKHDENKEYNPFNIEHYKKYVLFMMLKLKGLYENEHDEVFNVTYRDSRENNPLTNIPSVIRGELPFAVKEYDIKRAFPTFIDLELGIKRETDVYSLIDKRKFNMLLNLHKNSKNAKISNVRQLLYDVYGSRVTEVITDERFNNAGQMYRDLTVYEKRAIEDFVKVNDLTKYARLHDGIFVMADVECKFLEVNSVSFSVKECIKPKIENNTVSFYEIDFEGKVLTSPKMYADFFEQENFIRITEDGRDVITIFKDSNNVIKPFNHKTDIVPFLKENINEFDSDAVENQIANDSFGDIQKGYLLLKPIPLKYHMDDKHTFGIAFKNGFFEYDNKELEVKTYDYKKVDGFFAPHFTQDIEFTYQTQSEQSVFEKFLMMVSTGKNPANETLTDSDLKVFEKFCCMFGYLLHQYKNEAFNPAIVLSDAGANDKTRNGGRGKSMFTKAVSFVRNTMLKGGAEFDPAYLFNFADLTKAHDVYVIDDVPAGFNYNSLYTQISGGINCQLKGKPAQFIPFKESPKFVITTNWSFRVEDNSVSTERRFYEFQFTDFFNLENTPFKVFGHTLFDDWDSAEWLRFYNFCFGCVALFLQNGLQRIEYNKAVDNFRALFNDDAKLEEMARIIDDLAELKDSFTVSDFLNHYMNINNNLRFEKYFHSRNAKTLIDAYIKHHQLPILYSARDKKWVFNGAIRNKCNSVTHSVTDNSEVMF